MNVPIITSRLDNDYYNFTMGQLIWRHFPGVQVTYQLTNRTTGVELGKLVRPADLMAQIDHVRELGFSSGELDFLRAQGAFNDEYLEWLRAGCVLPPVEVEAWDGRLSVRYTGNWAEGVFWETPLLAIINQLANEARTDGHEAQILTEADRRTEAKLQRLARHPRIKFVEFGTRRRYNRANQEHVIERAMELVPKQLVGTSNVYMAYKYGLEPKGTMAHQLFMVAAALAEAAGSKRPIADSQALVLDLFEDMYGAVDDGKLLVFLPDTFGTATALSLLEPERAARWAGMRQDSGDAATQMQLMIDWHRQNGINPATNVFMPSDGLDDAKMITLDEQFGGQVRQAFGLGTYLTNDTPIPPVSIVIKPVLADGHPCVKLSDNLAKATGDPATILRRKNEAHYHVSYRLVPTV